MTKVEEYILELPGSVKKKCYSIKKNNSTYSSCNKRNI